MNYLILAVPVEHVESALVAFNDFFQSYLKRTDWVNPINLRAEWRDITSKDLFTVSIFNETQFTNGFTIELHEAALTHDPSFESFGAYADVSSNVLAFLNSCNLESIPWDEFER